MGSVRRFALAVAAAALVVFLRAWSRVTGEGHEPASEFAGDLESAALAATGGLTINIDVASKGVVARWKRDLGAAGWSDWRWTGEHPTVAAALQAVIDYEIAADVADIEGGLRG